jgi:1-acyl-sn-glycerol-3-phosphate acyltransferase
VENRNEWFMRQMLRIADWGMAPYHRAEVGGVERVPAGAALYVGNHSGGSMSIDTFIWAAAVFRTHGIPGLPYAMTHDLPLRLPGLHQVLPPMGAVRASPDNLRRLFDAGHKVLVYPGGDAESMRPFRLRNRLRFDGHHGYVRAALRHGVPLVPVVSQGSHSIFMVIDDFRWLASLFGVAQRFRLRSWPLVLSVPWGLTWGPLLPFLPLPAKIRVEILEPIRFDRSGAAAVDDRDYVAACAREVERRMQQVLDRLAAAAQV